MLHWHVRSKPDFDNILPIIFCCNQDNAPLSISCENGTLTASQKHSLNFLGIKYKIDPEPNPKTIETAIFEWGPGLTKNFFRRLVRENLSVPIHRNRYHLLRRLNISGVNLVALPHGFDVKYGFNNNSPGMLRSCLPLELLYSTRDRSVFDKYCVESFYQLERYSHFGLQPSNLYCIPYLPFYREWIGSYGLPPHRAEPRKYDGCNIFIMPKFSNNIHHDNLRSAISRFIKDSTFVFVPHPRHIEEHNNFFKVYFNQYMWRLTDPDLPILELIKHSRSVHDVGSSLGLLCSALNKPYYVHKYLSPATTIFDETQHPLIVQAPHQMPDYSETRYSAYCKKLYDLYVTKGQSFDEAIAYLSSLLWSVPSSRLTAFEKD